MLSRAQILQSPLASLYTSLCALTLPNGWIVNKFDDEVQCVQLRQQQSGVPAIIFHVLQIRNDLSWELHTANRHVSPESDVLCQQPRHLTTESAKNLIQCIDCCHLCTGNSEKQFIELAKRRKGKFLTTTGDIIAFLDDSFGLEGCSTIRHTNCAVLLSTSGVCSVCSNYCNTLRALLSRHRNQACSPHPNKNFRFFTTPQRRAHLQCLRKAIRNKNRQLKRLRAKLDILVENDSIEVDEDLTQDLQVIVESSNNSHSVKDEFKRIFWEQQVCISV